MPFLDAPGLELTRWLIQRSLGAVYLVAFLVAAHQFRPLAGERGLLPAPRFFARVSFRDAPSLFRPAPTDRIFGAAAWLGVALAAAATVGLADRFGLATSIAVWGLLWLLYLSFVNAGQVFYGYGWESLLLETGFVAVFLGPSGMMPSWVGIFLLRWVLFRVMFGAGLIKLRGDPCWRDLTCLVYHYETQPLPNPLSWYLHRSPLWLHKAGVLFTHLAQVVVPWGVFAPPPISYLAGALMIAFQGSLIVSGNLSWLNYLTLVLAFSCFDDALLGRLLPVAPSAALTPRPAALDAALVALALLVAALSVRPVRNLFSRRQLMNASFEPLHLVNTYGAFGSVTRERLEVVLEGAEEPVWGPATRWRELPFRGKPGDPARRPPVVAPYHRRLDWQMWFAALAPDRVPRWLGRLAAKLLAGDRAVWALLAANPFGERPPRLLRAELYRYRFTTPAERRRSGRWWSRERVGSLLPPVSLETPIIRELLAEDG